METILTKDEELIKEELLTANLLFFWLKTNFTLTNKRVVSYYPNTLLGLIPIGRKEITLPIKNIAAVTSSTKFHFGRLVFGLILVLVGFIAIKSFGWVLILLGAVLVLNSFTSTFAITNNAGLATLISLSILEKDKVAGLVRDVNHRIAEL